MNQKQIDEMLSGNVKYRLIVAELKKAQSILENITEKYDWDCTDWVMDIEENIINIQSEMDLK